MFKRMFWFILGAASGIWAYNTVRQQAAALQEQITPDAMLVQAKKIARRGWNLASSKVRDLISPPSETAPYDA